MKGLIYLKIMKFPSSNRQRRVMDILYCFLLLGIQNAKPKPKRPSKKDIIPGRSIRPADIATEEPTTWSLDGQDDDDNAEVTDEIFDDQQTNEPGTSTSVSNFCGVFESLFSTVFRHNYRCIYLFICL